jgi:hypothetical protein
MNTTSLITDYIIVGIIGSLIILIPYLMIDSNVFYFIISHEIKNLTILTIIITAVIYSFGIIFNQIADFIEKKLFKLFRIDVIDYCKNKIKSEVSFDHHYALQLIVYKSETAYNYISFRRTIIRIIRAFLSLTILLPIFHLFYIVIFLLLGKVLIFSLLNLIILILLSLSSYLIIRLQIKLYKGYYDLIINFALVINN